MKMGRCCCGPDCTIFTDNFAADNLATNYTTVAGSFSVSGGILTTTSAGALLIANTAGTTGHGRVQCDCKLSNSNTKIRVVGAYVDSSNYLFLELHINGNSSTLKLWKKVAGADTELDTHTFSGLTNLFYPLRLCWDGTNAWGFSPFIQTDALTGAYTGTGNKAGVGASPGAGTASFDNLDFSNLQVDNADCEDCSGDDTLSCTICENNVMPEFVKLVVAGVADNTCTNCDQLNGSYITTTSQSVVGFSPGCGDSSTPTACGSTTPTQSSLTPCSNVDSRASGTVFRLFLFKDGSDDYYLQVVLVSPIVVDPSYAGPNPRMKWTSASLGNFATPPDCFALIDGASLTFDCDDGGATNCNGAGSTVTVSVL
jgi:hypothetical protein